MPYKMPCGCVFCYFCLRTGLHERRGTDGDEMMYCLFCDSKITLPSEEELNEVIQSKNSIDNDGGDEEEEYAYDYSTIAVRV